MLDYSKWDALSESGASSCSDVEELVPPSDEAKLNESHDLGALKMAKGCDWTLAGLTPIIHRRLLKGRQEQELVALALQLCRCICKSPSQAARFTSGQDIRLLGVDNVSQAAPPNAPIDRRWVGSAPLQPRDAQDDDAEEAAQAARVEAESAQRQLAEAREAFQHALDAERRRGQQAARQVTVLAAALRRAQTRGQQAYERSAEALRQAQEEKELLGRRLLEETKLGWGEAERQQEEYVALAKAYEDQEKSLKLRSDEVRFAWEEIARLKRKHEDILNKNAALVGQVREQEEALKSARKRQCDMEQILHTDVSAVSQKMASYTQERDALHKSLESKELALQDAQRQCKETIEQLHREREEVKAWAHEVNKQALKHATEQSQEELLQKEQALQAARRECQEAAAQLVREREEAREQVEEIYRTARQEVLGTYRAETQLRLSSKEEVLNSAHEQHRELERLWRDDVASLSEVVASQRERQEVIERDLQEREERLQVARHDQEELQRRRCEEVRLVQEELERQKRSLRSLRERNKALERALHTLHSVEDVAEEDKRISREEAAREPEEAMETVELELVPSQHKMEEAMDTVELELVPSQHKMEEATDKRRKALAKAARAAQRQVEATQKRAYDLGKSLERAQREKRQAVRRVRRWQQEEPAYVPCEEEMLWWKSRAEDARQRAECQKAYHNAILSKKDKALKCMQDERDEARRKKQEELECAKKEKEAELWGASLQLKEAEEALAAKEASLQNCVKEKQELESSRLEEKENMQRSLKSCLRDQEELKTCVRNLQETVRKCGLEKGELERRRQEEQEILSELDRELKDLHIQKEAAEGEAARLRSEKEASEGAARQQQASALIGHTWQFQANNMTWIPFAPEQSERMMQAFLQGQDSFTMVHDGNTYEENFQDMVQTNPQTGKTRNIRCTFGLPTHWSMRDSDILQLLKQRATGSPSASTLASGTLGVLGTNLTFESVAQRITGKHRLREFTNILRSAVFHHSNDAWQATSECNRMKNKLVVTEVYHVENIHLLERYQANCKLLQSKHVQHGVEPASITPDLPQVLLDFGNTVGVHPGAGTINERLLFHGTSWETAMQIAMEGFDSRLARASGMYGKGTYFAAQSCKSHQYSGPGQVKTILLARVALGDPYYTAVCDRSVVRPPKQDTGEGPLCDSLIARPGWMRNHHSEYQTHMEFVIFEQMQAYPEFILRYRLVGSGF